MSAESAPLANESADPRVSGERPKPPRPHLAHVTALDGMRGLAVLFVLLFHLNWAFPDFADPQTLAEKLTHRVHDLLWSGWIGVDMFFVLSGYLITRGLVAPSPRPTGERMRLFWMRRVLRIFPLYYAVILVGALACVAVGNTEDFPGAAYWLYAQNYALAFDPKVLRWTAHLWSLAVEEQFYFVWPVVMLLASKRARVPVSLALFVVGAAMRLVIVMKGAHLLPGFFDGPEGPQKFAYRSTPTHMDGLLVGALLAQLEQDPAHPLAKLLARFRKPIAALSFVAFLGLFAWTRGFGTYDRRALVVGYPVMAAFFGSLVSLVTSREAPAFVIRLFDAGWLRSFGKVSYGMYIFHWPLLVLVLARIKAIQEGQSIPFQAGVSLAVFAGGVGLTYVLAQLSFRYFESPFLKLKHRFEG